MDTTLPTGTIQGRTIAGPPEVGRRDHVDLERRADLGQLQPEAIDVRRLSDEIGVEDEVGLVSPPRPNPNPNPADGVVGLPSEKVVEQPIRVDRAEDETPRGVDGKVEDERWNAGSRVLREKDLRGHDGVAGDPRPVHGDPANGIGVHIEPRRGGVRAVRRLDKDNRIGLWAGFGRPQTIGQRTPMGGLLGEFAAPCPRSGERQPDSLQRTCVHATTQMRVESGELAPVDARVGGHGSGRRLKHRDLTPNGLLDGSSDSIDLTGELVAPPLSIRGGDGLVEEASRRKTEEKNRPGYETGAPSSRHASFRHPSQAFRRARFRRAVGS